MNLKTKINLFTTLLTLFILATSFTAIFVVYKQFAFKTEYVQLQQRANELMTGLSKMDGKSNMKEFLRAYIPSNGAVRILNEEREQLIYMQATPTVERIPFTIEKNADYTISYWQHTPVIALAIPLLWPTGEIVTLQLLEPLPDISRNIDLLRWILIALAIVAIVPVYIASSILAGIIAKPIQQLTKTMQLNIQTNQYEQLPNEANRKDEIAEMTTTYNALMDKLEENYRKQQQFVGNASHELKTPLTVIESYAKLLQRRGFQNIDVTQEALSAITNETATMKAMITQMLQLASVSENVTIQFAEVAVKPILETIAHMMQQAYNREVRIIGNDFVMLSDADQLRQLLTIFIDNARKYSDEAVTVTLTDERTIVITDRGVGIAQKEIAHLFERFYRVDKARSRKTGGTGLGLPIAKQLAQLLQLHIDMESAVGVGTTVTLRGKEVLKHD